LGCTIDARAVDADYVRPGRIILATGRCVGRVLAMRTEAKQLVLTLGSRANQRTSYGMEAFSSISRSISTTTLVFEAPEWPGVFDEGRWFAADCG
jgi:hypothetical protein